MSSIFPKFLWAIEIDITNQTFGYDAGSSVDIDVDNYTTILELLDNLETKLGAGYTCSVSEIGIVSITKTSAWTADWGGTDNALETILGFDGTETVDGSYVLTATNQHTAGYYPGVISWGRLTTKGTGFATPLMWQPVWRTVGVRAGNNKMHTIGSQTPSYEASPMLGMISEDELTDDFGLFNFSNSCILSQFRLYPDRSDGTVATPGTEDTDYYTCKLLNRKGLHPKVGRGTGKYYTCVISMNRETES